MAQLISTPTAPHLQALLLRTQESLLVASPFIKLESAQWLCSHLAPHVKKSCYTRLKLASVAAGALDLQALDFFHHQKATLWNVDDLHAKIYMRDETEVLITSANLTYSGLNHNLEIGVLTQERSILEQCKSIFEQSLDKIAPGDWEKLKSELQKLPESVAFELDAAGQPSLSAATRKDLVNSFPKWKSAVWLALQYLPPEFTREELITKYLDEIVQRAESRGKTPEQTISRELQELRTLGFLEFLGNGRYRRTS